MYYLFKREEEGKKIGKITEKEGGFISRYVAQGRMPRKILEPLRSWASS